MASVTKPRTEDLKTVVAASAAGTTFEWYDFFIFGALTSLISKNFFSGLSESTGYMFALLTFALGFLARPVGALVFGRLGDQKGRKGTFLYTILIMGIATVLIGFLPTYEQAGIIAPILLLILRVIQGFALGGEYGGAVIYVAEHAPAHQRGRFTSWIQTSAAFGLMGALGVILVTRLSVGEAAFADWGWRIPFVISAGLLVVSVYIRAKTAESPSFKALHDQGAISKAPFAESFGKWSNLKQVLIALFGFMTAQGVIWYTTFFYTQVYLEKAAKLDGATINYLILAMTLVSAPLYIVFARLSDHYGRKPVMIGGILLASLTFFPGFQAMLAFANPALDQAIRNTPVVLKADPKTCQFQFDPVGKTQFTSPCDIAKATLANLGVPYQNLATPGISFVVIAVDGTDLKIASGERINSSALKALKAETSAKVKALLKASGYPEKADPKRVNVLGIFMVLVVFTIGATALYGPMASALVEMFPTRVRYTALSLPYHVGNGWFGGLLPAIAFAMVTASGDVHFGLWYPVVTGLSAALIAFLFMKETKGRDLDRIN
jgi:MFS family permease